MGNKILYVLNFVRRECVWVFRPALPHEPDPNAVAAIEQQPGSKRMSKSFKFTLSVILIIIVYGTITQFGSYRSLKHRVMMFFSTTVSNAQSIRSFRSPNPMGQNIGLITQNPSVTPLYNDEKESVYRL